MWYIADVATYDESTSEHLLRYPDGDTEWVRIGEDHTTTNAQYREYYRNNSTTSAGGRHDGGIGVDDANDGCGSRHAGNNCDDGGTGGDVGGEIDHLNRMPSFANGVSFALSAMSQSFGIPIDPSVDMDEGGGGGRR
jgi:hypothetical protein